MSNTQKERQVLQEIDARLLTQIPNLPSKEQAICSLFGKESRHLLWRKTKPTTKGNGNEKRHHTTKEQKPQKLGFLNRLLGTPQYDAKDERDNRAIAGIGQAE